MRSLVRRARAVGGWLAVAAGLGCVLLSVAGAVLGARPLVVRTGSMVPAIPVGSVVLAVPRPAAAVHPGDVYGVRHPGGRLVLHRLQQVTASAGTARTMVFRGDANRVGDQPVTATSVLRPVVVVPAAGRWLGLVHRPWSQFWLGVLTGIGALVLLRRRREVAWAPPVASPSS